MYLFLLGFLADCTSDTPKEPPEATPQDQAIAFLDAWDGPNFKIARAALRHMHPEQAEFVFNGLTAARGAESVAAVAKFLERIEVLRSGSDPARESVRQADREAVELLANRRILTPEIEADLLAKIDTASTIGPATEAGHEEEEDAELDP